jgi:hypothetical protein
MTAPADGLPTFHIAQLMLRPRHIADLEDCLAMDRRPYSSPRSHLQSARARRRALATRPGRVTNSGCRQRSPNRDGVDILHPRRQRQSLPRGATILGPVDLSIISGPEVDLVGIGLVQRY